MPAISIDGVVAQTTTMDTFKGPKFEKFLKYDLVSLLFITQLFLLLTTPKN